MVLDKPTECNVPTFYSQVKLYMDSILSSNDALIADLLLISHPMIIEFVFAPCMIAT
jgi:hypothetical protein